MYIPDHEYELLIAGIREIKEKSLSNLNLAKQASLEMSKLKSENLRLKNEMLDLQIRYNDLCVASMDVIGDNVDLKTRLNELYGPSGRVKTYFEQLTDTDEEG